MSIFQRKAAPGSASPAKVRPLALFVAGAILLGVCALLARGCYHVLRHGFPVSRAAALAVCFPSLSNQTRIRRFEYVCHRTTGGYEILAMLQSDKETLSAIVSNAKLLQFKWQADGRLRVMGSQDDAGEILPPTDEELHEDLAERHRRWWDISSLKGHDFAVYFTEGSNGWSTSFAHIWILDHTAEVLYLFGSGT